MRPSLSGPSGLISRSPASTTKAKKNVQPLADALDSRIVMPLDVGKPGQMEDVFERVGKDWGSLDFLVHSIAFSPKETPSSPH
jgi:enoyl-[acyl-carrier-protein] reductase (NADH)